MLLLIEITIYNISYSNLIYFFLLDKINSINTFYGTS